MERSILTPCRRSVLGLFPTPSRSLVGQNLALNFRRPDRLSGSSSSSSRAFASSPHPAKTKRALHSSRAQNNDTVVSSEIHQAYPLSGYYADLLSFHNPQHRSPAAPATTSALAQGIEKDFGKEKDRELTKEEKMSIVFGTRLAGPGYESTSRYNPETMPPDSTWKTVNGIPVPPRPTEPDNCCMSGCVHCVWDDFRDDLEYWASRVKEVQAKAKAADTNTTRRSSDMRQTPRAEVASASVSMDDDGGGSETNWEMPTGTGAGEDLFAGIPVGIKEFMKIEKRLREKKQTQQQSP